MGVVSGHFWGASPVLRAEFEAYREFRQNRPDVSVNVNEGQQARHFTTDPSSIAELVDAIKRDSQEQFVGLLNRGVPLSVLECLMREMESLIAVDEAFNNQNYQALLSHIERLRIIQDNLCHDRLALRLTALRL